jgi:hypothetical protein
VESINKQAKDLEKKIKTLEDKVLYGAITSSGRLNLKSVLQYILKGDRKAKLRYSTIIIEFNKIKNHPDFAERYNGIVKPETLKKIRLYNSYLVRPSKCGTSNGLFYGTILKLPSVNSFSQLPDGDGWKSLIKKEEEINVQDAVFYTNKTDIVLDNETLHLVGYFEGKIME